MRTHSGIPSSSVTSVSSRDGHLSFILLVLLARWLANHPTPSDPSGSSGRNVVWNLTSAESDAFCDERWACRETHPVGTPFRTFDHGGTTYYHASRNCGQACLDDHACISYDFEVGSQADSCRFCSGQRCRRTAQRKPAMDTAVPL